MRNNRNIFIIIKILIIIMITIFQSQCGTKETVKKEIKGNVIFLIGSVEVFRNGSNIASLNLGDIIREGDIIKTGDKSEVIIQIGESEIIKIMRNTEAKIISLFMNNNTEIFLERGEVISKIFRLLKDENYFITTTMLKAAVRGTTFSVSTFNNEEKVAVLKGKVFVAINENISKKPVKETYVNEGEIAAIRATVTETSLKEVKIKVMPVDKTNLIELEKAEMLELVPDIENVKVDELNIRQQEMLKKEENPDKDAEKPDAGTVSKINAATIEQLIKKKTRTLEEIKKVNGRIDEITLNSGEIIKGAIISKGNVYSVLTIKGVVNVPQKDIGTINIVR